MREASYQRRTREAREIGKCPTCRCRWPRIGRKTCDVCIARAGERRRQWRADGKCVDCLIPGQVNRRCDNCQAFHAAYESERLAAKRSA